jgi:hypothetical protein
MDWPFVGNCQLSIQRLNHLSSVIRFMDLALLLDFYFLF